MHRSHAVRAVRMSCLAFIAAPCGVGAHGNRTHSDAWNDLLLRSPEIQTWLKFGDIESNDVESETLSFGQGFRQHVCGIAVVGSGVCSMGPLTMWNRREQALLESLPSFGDECSLRVVVYYPLKQPHQVHWSVGLRGGPRAGNVRKCPPYMVHDVLLQQFANGSEGYESCKALPDLDTSNVIAVEVPLVLRVLMEKQLWQELIVSGRFLLRTEVFRQWPPPKSSDAWDTFGRKRLASTTDVEPLAKLRCVADTLRIVWSEVHPHLPEERRSRTQELLEYCVESVSFMEESFRAPAAKETTDKWPRYKASSLVQVMLAAGVLKDASRLTQCIIATVPLLFPTCMQQDVLAALSGDDSRQCVYTLSLPCATTMKVLRLQIDAALAITFRDRLDAMARPYLLVLWVDSSPQGKRNWLLIVGRYVYKDRLGIMMDAFDRLIAVDSVETEQDMADICTWSSALTHNMHLHNFLPAAMGAKAESIEDKVAATESSLRFEQHSVEHFQELRACILGVCTDLGTERIMNAAMYVPAQRAFWMIMARLRLTPTQWSFSRVVCLLLACCTYWIT